MKTLSQVKDDIARKYKYPDFQYIKDNMSAKVMEEITDEVAIAYAEQEVDRFARGLTHEFNNN